MSKLPLLMVRRGSHLVPTDSWSEEQLRALDDRKEYNVTCTLARGERSKRAGEQRWYWAGLGLLADNIDDTRWPNSRKLHELILENLGYTTKRWRIDNTFELVPDSIALDEMADDDFFVFFERARTWVLTNFGIEPWDLWKMEKSVQQAERNR